MEGIMERKRGNAFYELLHICMIPEAEGEKGDLIP